MNNAKGGRAPQADSSSQSSNVELGMAAITKGDFGLAKQYLRRRATAASTDEDGRGHPANNTSTSQYLPATPAAPSDGDNEPILKYLLSKFDLLEMRNRQILDAVETYEPSTLRSEIRQDVSEIVESQAQHLQQMVEFSIGNAFAKLEAALVNANSTNRKAIQAPSVSLAIPRVRLAPPETASACGQDATKENKTMASAPAHESEACQLPLHLVSDGESDEQQPVASVETATQQAKLARHCVTFKSDAESVKALAASSGWLQGVHCKHVTQPGAIAEQMLRAPAEDNTLSRGRTQEVIEEHQHSQSKLERIISSPAFETTSAVLILVNACVSGVVAHVSTRRAVDGASSSLPFAFQMIQVVLTSCFFIEWLIRLAAHGTKFFTCRDKGWHVFDTIIVAVSTMDIIVGLIESGASLGSLIRIFRFFRLIRALRMIRVLRVFQELRYIIQSIRRSAIILIWPMVFVCILAYMCAIVIANTVPKEIREAAVERRNLLIKDFGSFLSAMKTLFMSASGGMDWSVPADTLASGDATSYMAFVVFIIASKFLLFNLLSGIFVLSVFENVKADDQRMLQEQLLTANSCGARLREILEELDVTGNGSISVRSLEHLLLDPLLMDIVDELNMETNQVAGVFKLLDVGDSGYVNIDEFIITLFRLRGHSQLVDLPSLLHESRKIACHLMNAVQDNEDRVAELKESLKIMQLSSEQNFKRVLDSQKSQRQEP